MFVKNSVRVGCAAVGAAVLAMGGQAYAQRSLGADDMFVFDKSFSKTDFSKRYSSTGEHFWDNFVHEFAFYEGAGYSAVTGLAKGGIGNNTGLAYICNFLPPDWAILVGAEFGVYSSRYRNVPIEQSYAISDVVIPALGISDKLEYWVKMKGVNETARLFFINIPVMVRYLFSISFFGNATGQANYQFASPDVHTFYAMGGVKIGVPIYNKYTSTYAEADVYQFNAATGQTHTGQGTYGLDTYKDGKGDGTITAGTSVILSLEFGYMLPLTKIVMDRAWHDKVRFYGGIFFDYGLNRLADPKGAPMMYDWTAPTTPEFVSVTAANPMHNMTIGLKVTASFSVGGVGN